MTSVNEKRDEGASIAALREQALVAEIESLREQLKIALRIRPVFAEANEAPSIPDFRMVEYSAALQVPSWPKLTIRVGLSMESFTAYRESLPFTVEEATRELIRKSRERWESLSEH